MTAVTTATLFSLPDNRIYDLVNTRANIADPRDDTGSRKFVYRTEPFHKSFDFSEYPYIYLSFPNITQSNPTINGKQKYVGYTQTLIARTIKDGSGASRTDAGVTDMKSMVDDIFETFNSETNKSSIRESYLYNLNITLLNSDSMLMDQQDIHETEFEITYDMRFTVSA